MFIVMKMFSRNNPEANDAVRPAGRGARMVRGTPIASKDRPAFFYETEEEARLTAETLAKASPMIPYAVMKINEVYETAPAPVICKTVNAEGELVLKQQEE